MYKNLVYGDPVRGYPSLVVIILFFGGVNLTALGIIGEYIGRIVDETKNRPLYFVKDYNPSEKTIRRTIWENKTKNAIAKGMTG